MRPLNKRKLTQIYVERISPQAKSFCAWDTEQKGLCLQVRPNGYRAYKVVYPFQGRTRWFHLGAVTEISLGQARKLAQEVMYQKAQGKDPQGERRSQRRAGTFADLVEAYFRQHGEKQRSWKQFRYCADRHLLPAWGHLLPGSITRSDVKALMRTITAPVLANKVLAMASIIFSWAIREEVAGVTANPCSQVDRNAVRSRERILSDSELPLFWNAFSQISEIRKFGEAGKVLKLILLTGQRPGEVCAMKRRHIRDGWWELPGQADAELGWPGTKNKRTHRVWLPQPAWEVLALSGDRTGDVAAIPATWPSVTQLAAAMRMICKQLGITDKVTPHDLRRTHGTFVTRLGFGRSAMNRLQNHVEGGIGSVYDRYGYADENQRIMEAVAGEIVRLAEGRPVEPNVVALRA
jgi:integrase